MRRVDGWELALFNETTAAMGRPYEWGKHDCATFAADCVKAMTGEDPIEGLRDGWHSLLGARKALDSIGAATLGDAAAMFLDEIQVSEARRGDVMLCEGGEDGPFLAICVGHTAVGPASNGLIHVPKKQALRAYRVGD